MKNQDYKYIVAGHLFTVSSKSDADLSGYLAAYSPFAVSAGEAEEKGLHPVFSLSVVDALERPEEMAEELRQDDEGSMIVVSRTPDGRSWLEFILLGVTSGRMLVSADYREAALKLDASPAYGLSNALMVMYALSTARLQTALFHAAVIGCDGRGYLFLGKSGTGKSTHARLWLKHIEGSELVNDDNPVVRIGADGVARVYGSPWSGKTPCYRNMELPAGGFVQLAQAPYNRIRRLKGVPAYAALVPSISGKRWDRSIADGLHETEDALASRVPVWHLDCLPDEAAAQLCFENVSKA